MKADAAPVSSVDQYISAAAPKARPILKRIRAAIRKAAPDAAEKISYRMPAYFQNGIVIYFAAFKQHIGLYPPVRDPKLKREVSPYAGEKGNLRFPFDKPIPYALIAKIAKSRLRENLARKR